MVLKVVSTSGGGGGSGTVTRVQGNGTVNGITLTGDVTSAGNLTLGGALANVTNAQLQNSNVIINGTTVNLGSNVTIGAAPTGTAGGDLTGTYPNPTLNTSGVVAGIYGNASTVSQVTVDAKGRVTTAANVAILISNTAIQSGSITIGNTSIGLGNTATTLGNVQLQNANIASVSATFPNSFLSNSSSTIGNTAVTLGGTVTSLGNVTLANVTIPSGNINVTTTNHTANVTANATFLTSSLPLVPQGYIVLNLNGTLVKVPYYQV